MYIHIYKYTNIHIHIHTINARIEAKSQGFYLLKTLKEVSILERLLFDRGLYYFDCHAISLQLT